MKVVCKKCKSSWTDPENLVGEEVSFLGEYIKKWKCPQCGHVVVFSGAPQLGGVGMGGGVGAVFEADMDPKMPSVVEG